MMNIDIYGFLMVEVDAPSVMSRGNYYCHQSHQFDCLQPRGDAS